MKNIVVDFEAKAITITRNYSKRAGIVGTPEYRTLVEVMREFPDYKLCIKSSPSRISANSKLTYSDMVEYINSNVDESQRKEKLLQLQWNKAILGFAQAKTLFLKEFMSPEEVESKDTVA